MGSSMQPCVEMPIKWAFVCMFCHFAHTCHRQASNKQPAKGKEENSFWNLVSIFFREKGKEEKSFWNLVSFFPRKRKGNIILEFSFFFSAGAVIRSRSTNSQCTRLTFSQ